MVVNSCCEILFSGLRGRRSCGRRDGSLSSYGGDRRRCEGLYGWRSMWRWKQERIFPRCSSLATLTVSGILIPWGILPAFAFLELSAKLLGWTFPMCTGLSWATMTLFSPPTTCCVFSASTIPGRCITSEVALKATSKTCISVTAWHMVVEGLQSAILWQRHSQKCRMTAWNATLIFLAAMTVFMLASLSLVYLSLESMAFIRFVVGVSALITMTWICPCQLKLHFFHDISLSLSLSHRAKMIYSHGIKLMGWILQFDIFGSAHGLLASHPLTPFLSMHHLELIEPVFPGLTALEGLKHLTKAMRNDPANFLQQSICYDQKLGLSFSISLGYVVQVFPEIILPRLLTTVETSFTAWNHNNHALEFSFDTRPVPTSVCKQPFLFYMEEMHIDESNNRQTVGTYKRYMKVDDAKKQAYCWFHRLPPRKLKQITVISDSLDMHWYMVSPLLCGFSWFLWMIWCEYFPLSCQQHDWVFPLLLEENMTEILDSDFV